MHEKLMSFVLMEADQSSIKEFIFERAFLKCTHLSQVSMAYWFMNSMVQYLTCIRVFDIQIGFDSQNRNRDKIRNADRNKNVLRLWQAWEDTFKGNSKWKVQDPSSGWNWLLQCCLISVFYCTCWVIFTQPLGKVIQKMFKITQNLYLL